MVLHVVTYSTSPEKVAYLLESAKLHNVQVHNLATSAKWNGFISKLIAITTFIDNLPNDDIVCFVDAYDVIINADTDTILAMFHSKKVELLFGAEINLHPPSLKEIIYPESPTLFRYVNSGFYIGYVRAIKSMLVPEDYLKLTDDQEYISRYYVANHTSLKLHLDVQTNMVLNMYKVMWDALEIKSGVVKFIPFQTAPCFIHFNGMSYLDINKDYVKIDGRYSFEYNKVYSRTFMAVLEAKRISKAHDIVCHLTGRGSSY